MRTAICTIAYNEARYIEACINNWKGLVDKHLVLVSKKAWNGGGVLNDNTDILAVSAGAVVETGVWLSEHEQRNYGLEILKDYDRVLIVDPDEFYTKEDQGKILKTIADPSLWRTNAPPVFSAYKMVTYWKTDDYILNPPDKHKPVIAVDPKNVEFYETRQTRDRDGSEEYSRKVYPINVTCHHMSWVRSDNEVLDKITAYSHSGIIPPDWYHDVWMSWNPGDGLEVRPYGREKSLAVYSPAPKEIKVLLEKNN